MEIKITVTADDALLKALNGIALGLQGHAAPTLPIDADTKEKVNQAMANLKERKEKEVVEEPEPRTEPVQEEPATAKAPQYTIEQVREAFGELSKSKGREAAKGILADLGAKSVSNLQPDQFAEAMEKIQGAA